MNETSVYGMRIIIPPSPAEPPEDRLLPTGTPVVLCKPYNGRTQGRVGYFIGRNSAGRDLYAIVFEGYTNTDGTARAVDFARSEFVLARAGT